MNFDQAESLLDEQGVQADPTHIAAAATTLTALFRTTAECFGKLPLETEPSAFAAELRRNAP